MVDGGPKSQCSRSPDRSCLCRPEHFDRASKTRAGTSSLKNAPRDARPLAALAPRLLVPAGSSRDGRAPLLARGGRPPRHHERKHHGPPRRRRIAPRERAARGRGVRALHSGGAGGGAHLRGDAHAAHRLWFGHLARGPHPGNARRRLPRPLGDERCARGERGGHGLPRRGGRDARRAQHAPPRHRLADARRPGRRRLHRRHGGHRSNVAPSRARAERCVLG
jgi:hypothetical protein